MHAGAHDQVPLPTVDEIRTLDEIQRRVLWLAVRMVDHANRERTPSPTPPAARQSSR
ncbi:MAG: hypothetical protein R2713_03265 [Ilumatobacteraceae bacterium]